MESNKRLGIILVLLFTLLISGSLFFIKYEKTLKDNEINEIKNYIENSSVPNRSSADTCAVYLSKKYNNLFISISFSDDYYTFNCNYSGEQFDVIKQRN